LDVALLQQLIGEAMSGRGIVERVEGGRTFRIDARAAVAAVAAAKPAPLTVDEAPADVIVAPCFGIVHLAPSPGAPPFVMPGDALTPGQKVCLVEAMKVFSAVVATRTGKLAQVLVGSGDEVARGQSLFRLAPKDG